MWHEVPGESEKEVAVTTGGRSGVYFVIGE
jgi:TRAP-type uncharacterized transport system substrate-binding protein